MTRGAIFAVDILLMAVSFPRMFVREDEKHLVKDGFGLNVKDTDGDLSNGVEEAFSRLWDGHRELHDIKNVVHEWVKARPKLAAKFFPFLAFCMGVVGFVVGVSV